MTGVDMSPALASLYRGKTLLRSILACYWFCNFPVSEGIVLIGWEVVNKDAVAT